MSDCSGDGRTGSGKGKSGKGGRSRSEVFQEVAAGSSASSTYSVFFTVNVASLVFLLAFLC